jgi:dTDP-4-amino-4,6-dideoxy-D-galactose acyltransferase
MTSRIEYKSWDSDFFGRKIGSLLVRNLNELNSIDSQLQFAQHQGYDLLYVITNSEIIISDSILEEFNGNLVDIKNIYEKQIVGSQSSTSVESYKQEAVHDDLHDLTQLSGKYSRFKIDHRFSETDFKRLYSEWITKSVHRILADEVFVYRHQGRIIGFVTVSVKNEIGEVGLIAVDPKSQGQKIGSKLIQRVESFVHDRGGILLKIPTQKKNMAACSFYLKNGFDLSSSHNIYHFSL